MRFTEVERVPNRKRRHKLDKELDEFMRLEIKVGLCHFEEERFVNSKSAQNTIQKAAKHWGYPIQVVQRKGEVFLVRTDM